MYTLVKTFVKSFGNDHRWTEADIGDMAMKDIYLSYRTAYAVLENNFLPDQVTLDVSKIKSEYGVSELTFNEMLAGLGNKALPTVNTVPELQDRVCRYRDAVKAGYKIYPANSKKSWDAEIPRGDKTDLFLKHKSVDFNTFGKYCMVSVNGFFHMVDAQPDGAWVIDGMKSNLVSNLNLCGIHSFADLGEIKHIPIKANMVSKLSENQGLRYQMCIKVGEPLEDKTVILVLGGYMHILDSNVFYQLNDDSIMVNTGRLPLLDRYQESRRYLDFEGMPFETTDNNDSMINVDDFLSDENILAWATMSQSFVVLVDNKELYTEKSYVRNPPTPKLLISFEKPEYPLFHGIGKVVEYWDRHEHGQWGLSVDDNQWSKLVYHTAKPVDAVIMGDSEHTQKPVELSRAYFLKIRSDLSIKV